MSGERSEACCLATETGGAGSPTLLLLHGLGTNAAVWHGLEKILSTRWPGRWLAPDLRGHGRSFHQGPYAAALHAADVANLLNQEEETVILGHSMGGLVGMVLGSGWFGIKVRQVIALGTKVEWKAEEAAKWRDRGLAGVRWFETRREAAEAYLRFTGLQGLVDPDSPVALRGIVQEDGKFRLAMDPAAARMAGGAPADRIFAAMRSPLRMMAGDGDPLVTTEQMRHYDPEPILLPGLAHNAHVQAPEMVWNAVEPILRANRSAASKA